MHCIYLLQEESELIKGKVDWKGRAAVKHQHGGMRAGLLILSMLHLFFVALRLYKIF